MTKLEKQIEAALAELLEENKIQEVVETEEELLAENMERKQKKRDTQRIRESRKTFRRWRKQAGF